MKIYRSAPGTCCWFDWMYAEITDQDGSRLLSASVNPSPTVSIGVSRHSNSFSLIYGKPEGKDKNAHSLLFAKNTTAAPQTEHTSWKKRQAIETSTHLSDSIESFRMRIKNNTYLFHNFDACMCADDEKVRDDIRCFVSYRRLKWLAVIKVIDCRSRFEHSKLESWKKHWMKLRDRWLLDRFFQRRPILLQRIFAEWAYKWNLHYFLCYVPKRPQAQSTKKEVKMTPWLNVLKKIAPEADALFMSIAHFEREVNRNCQSPYYQFHQQLPQAGALGEMPQFAFLLLTIPTHPSSHTPHMAGNRSQLSSGTRPHIFILHKWSVFFKWFTITRPAHHLLWMNLYSSPVIYSLVAVEYAHSQPTKPNRCLE